MVYPDWWKVGAKVIGNDGSEGTVSRGMGGGWSIEFEPLATGQGVPIRRYLPSPNPKDWQQKARLALTEVQVNQVTHDADRAFLACIGRGARGCEWASVPDSQREIAVYATSLSGDGYADVRKKLVDAIRSVLHSYL